MLVIIIIMIIIMNVTSGESILRIYAASAIVSRPVSQAWIMFLMDFFVAAKKNFAGCGRTIAPLVADWRVVADMASSQYQCLSAGSKTGHVHYTL